MAVKREGDKIEDLPYHKNHDLNESQEAKIKHYLTAAHEIPSHKRWFRDEVMGHEVIRLCALEAEWDKMTKIIDHRLLVEGDLDSSRKILNDRDKIANQLDKVRKGLGFNAKLMSTLDKSQLTEENEMDTEIDRWQEDIAKEHA